jgi:dTDP-4-amino-4,6-dideoxygalactose transaminase
VCFSFYATKNLTTGEGGMVVTRDTSLFNRMKTLCLHGISRDAWQRYGEKGNWYYAVEECGFKYNLSDILSSVGIHQLRKQENLLRERLRIALSYNKAFAELPEVEVPPDNAVDRHSWHLYSLRLNLAKLSIDRDAFIRELQLREIGASVHFIPIPLHPAFRELGRMPQNSCPRALELYPRLISLPLYPSMTDQQVHAVVKAVREIVVRFRATVIPGVGQRTTYKAQAGGSRSTSAVERKSR